MQGSLFFIFVLLAELIIAFILIKTEGKEERNKNENGTKSKIRYTKKS